MVNIVFVMEGEDILANAHTMDAIIIYSGPNFVPNFTRKNYKVAQHRGSGHSTTGKLHPAKAGIRYLLLFDLPKGYPSYGYEAYCSV